MKRIFKQAWMFFILTILFVAILSINSFAESEKLVMFFSSGGSGKTLTAAAADFEEKTGIEMEVLTFPMDEVKNKQVLALTQGAPIPDIIAVEDGWFVNYQKFLEPLELDEETKEIFIPSFLDLFRWPKKEGDYYCLPVRVGSMVVIYREDVFAEHGINAKEIKTWEDVLEVAIKISNPNEREWGFIMALLLNTDLTTSWLNTVQSYGVELLTPDYQKAAFNTENAIKATQTYVDIINKAAPPGCVSYNNADQIEALQIGMATMAMIYSPRFQSINDPQFPYSGKFKALPAFPYGEGSGLSTGVSVPAGWGLGVNKYSKNKDIAEEFVKFVASEEEQLKLAIDYSNTPTVSFVYTNSEYLEVIPIAAEIMQSMQSGKSRPTIANWVSVEDAIALQIGRAIIGDISVSEALATAEKNVNKILASE